MKRKLIPGLIIVVALLGLTGFAQVNLSGLTRAHAQTGGGYDLTWWTVDGGGVSVGVESPNPYVLIGTIGQPDAGAMSGGGYTLVGGFWGGAASLYKVYLPLVTKP